MRKDEKGKQEERRCEGNEEKRHAHKRRCREQRSAWKSFRPEVAGDQQPFVEAFCSAHRNVLAAP